MLQSGSKWGSDVTDQHLESFSLEFSHLPSVALLKPCILPWRAVVPEAVQSVTCYQIDTKQVQEWREAFKKQLDFAVASIQLHYT